MGEGHELPWAGNSFETDVSYPLPAKTSTSKEHVVTLFKCISGKNGKCKGQGTHGEMLSGKCIEEPQERTRFGE